MRHESASRQAFVSGDGRPNRFSIHDTILLDDAAEYYRGNEHASLLRCGIDK
jgi:hypothetical protein